MKMPDPEPQSVSPEAYFRQRVNVGPLLEQAWDGRDVRVAVLDTGIEESELPGAPPIWDVDFSGDGHPHDRQRRHGTWVASCIRYIAPNCELVNAKVVGTTATASKSRVAEAVRSVAASGVNIINLSLDFDSDGCRPDFKWVISDEWSDLPGVSVTRAVLDRSSACDLCQACWDVARAGVAVVAAAGNRRGAPIQCPGQAPGVSAAIATTLRSEWERSWSSLSPIKRHWRWRIRGNEARRWGTSFSAGYASGIYADLWPEIGALGWLESLERWSQTTSEVPAATVDAMDLLRRLRVHPKEIKKLDMLGVLEATEARFTQDINHAFALARLHQNLAGQMKAVELIVPVPPNKVSRATRDTVAGYLEGLLAHPNSQVRATIAQHTRAQELLPTWRSQ